MGNFDELIFSVKQPTFDDEMIKKLIKGLGDNYYMYLQNLNAIQEGSGELDLEAEKSFWKKQCPVFNQDNIFQHMGGLYKIDYCISRLYINCSKKDIIKLIQLFTEKCKDKDFPFYYKYCCDEKYETKYRADQIVIYSNISNIEDYIKILREIKQENPDIVNRCGKPPILTGTIDEWIGIGDNPIEKGKSFTEVRSNIIERVLLKEIPYIEDEEGFRIYNYEQIDFDEIREKIRKEFETIGVDLEQSCFNKENIDLYMSDDIVRKQYDWERKQEVRNNRDRLLKQKKLSSNYMGEQIPYLGLKILKQMESTSDELEQMVIGASSRYGFLTDVIKPKDDISKIIQDKFDLPIDIIVSKDFSIKQRDINGMIDLPIEQAQKLNSKIFTYVKSYYIDFFNNELSRIEDTLQRYSEIDKIPIGQNEDIDIERVDLYTKMKMLAMGKQFFEKIGISSENTELLCGTIQDFMFNLQQKKEEEEKSEIQLRKSIIDREYLYEALKGTGITDSLELRKIYENQEDIRVSDEDLEAVLLSLSNNKSEINLVQIENAIEKAGIGLIDINKSTIGMKNNLLDNKTPKEGVKSKDE